MKYKGKSIALSFLSQFL